MGDAADAQVVIVGAGFAGLEAARALGRAGIPTTIVDRENYHLFVPLLYQVAAGALPAAEIAKALRVILRRYDSVSVRQATVSGVDHERRRVQLADGDSLSYSHLLLATGARTAYFGQAGEWSHRAPGLKSIADAKCIRSRLLGAFERAEHCEDPQERRRLMSVVIVGGGSTGVELAGAIGELVTRSMAGDFRRIDPADARILLIEAGERLLPEFPASISDYACEVLERLGVEVMLDSAIERLGDRGVTLSDGREIPAGTMIWGAGIRATPAAGWLGIDAADRMGRIGVAPDLSVPGRPGVFAAGDLARFESADGGCLPPLGQVAKQQGKYLGRSLAARLQHGREPSAFRFRNRGNAAIIGRYAGVVDLGGALFRGVPAWMIWAGIHILLLSGLENRVLVSLQWLWRVVSYRHNARLIDREAADAGTGKRVEDG